MILRILLILVVPAFGIFLGLLYKGIDRILTARMQGRVGPPVTQPFRDVSKLLAKENLVPEDAVKWVFNSMPALALASSICILLYVPLGMEPVMEGHGDMILVLYLLIFPSLALVFGAFASSSVYADVGGQREMIKMMSYEFPLATAVISVAWLLYSSNVPNVFSFSAAMSNPVWGLVGIPGFAGLLLIFSSLMFVIPGELGRVPFDVSEADSEIAGGVFVEYSGRNLALFYIADAVKTIAIASIVIGLFLPYGISGLLGVSGPAAMGADFAFSMIKLLCVVFFGSSLPRALTGRLRISQVVTVYWKYALMLSLAGLLLIVIDTGL